MAKAKSGEKKRRISKLLPRKPKRTANAFGAFMREVWPTIPNAYSKPREALKEAAIRWGALTEERKADYREMLIDDRNRYTEQMALWRRQKAFLTRPASTYALFVKDVWARGKEDDSNNPTDIPTFSKMASEEWRALSRAQKEVYRQRFERSRRNYERSVEDFRAGYEVDLDRKLDVEEEYVSQVEAAEPESNEDALSDDDLSDDDLSDDDLSEDEWFDEDDDIEMN